MAETHIETAFDVRKRERAEEEGTEAPALPQPKTQDQIAQEKTKVDSNFRSLFSDAKKEEVSLLNSTLIRLSKIPALNCLSDKIILNCNLLQVTDQASSVAFSNSLTKAVVCEY